MNPVPVRPPNPVPAVVPTPISAAVVTDQIPDITSKTHGKETRGEESTFISPGRVLTEKERAGKIKKKKKMMTITSSGCQIWTSKKSNKKLRKENLNPGEAEAMDYKGQSSIKVGDKFQWVRIAPPEPYEETTNLSEEVLDQFNLTSEVWEPFPKTAEILESHLQAKKANLAVSQSTSVEQELGREEKEREP
ncbi:MAG: hypothetical protein GY696_16405, partial [Gammaproteobacteria bacterium]|nr:hypothetical protein [Gammaproteobacteria bacterium]